MGGKLSIGGARGGSKIKNCEIKKGGALGQDG